MGSAKVKKAAGLPEGFEIDTAPSLPEGFEIDTAPSEESLGHWAGRNALELLPAAGLVGGGVLGAPAGPVGSVAGGAGGYAAGKSLERLGKEYLLGDKSDTVPTGLIDQGKQVGKDLAIGGALEMGGQAIGPALSLAGRGAKSAGSAVRGLIEKNPRAFEIAKKAGDFVLPKAVTVPLKTLGRLLESATPKEAKAIESELKGAAVSEEALPQIAPAREATDGTLLTLPELAEAVEAQAPKTAMRYDPIRKKMLEGKTGLLGEKTGVNPFKEAFKRSDAVRRAREAEAEYWRNYGKGE